jgi:formyltetrahydrofolate deformylase
LSDFILTLSCADRAGIVAAVTGYLFNAGCFLVQNDDFGDPATGRYFMRVTFKRPAGSMEAVRNGFAEMATRFGMEWRIDDAHAPTRTLILVSQAGHCLNDLLYRWRMKALPVDIVGIASNHGRFAADAAFHQLPFHYLPVTPETKATQEAALLDLIESTQAELVVLARYMQVLSTSLCAKLSGKCINIHHSFLPSFKGAKPYHQAHERGVKLIGATAHFVTTDLDEGPIIEQDIERVDHTRTPDELAEIGRDIESRVLARAVKWMAERRVLLNGRKTVVFR